MERRRTGFVLPLEVLSERKENDLGCAIRPAAVNVGKSWRLKLTDE
jgi:hypothetical protein